MCNVKLFGSKPAVLLASILLVQASVLAASEEHSSASASLPMTAAGPTNAAGTADAAPEATNLAPAAVLAEASAEQQRLLLRALEQIRQEAKAVARQNAESITGRLALIEQSLAGERQRELEAIQKWNLYTLLIVGGFAILGFLALLLVAPFLVRSLNRMSDAATTLRLNEVTRAALPAPGAGDFAFLSNPAVAQSTARFLEAMNRVERRIEQLEHSSATAPALDVPSNGSSRSQVTHQESLNDRVDSEPATGGVGNRTELVLEKAQALLRLGQPERALACFEEAIALAPECADVHVKRGQAFEKLKRTDDALASYERAIALDKSSTTAHLLKGSLLNQLGRYNEALQCYELALRVQQGDRVPAA